MTQPCWSCSPPKLLPCSSGSRPHPSLLLLLEHTSSFLSQDQHICYSFALIISSHSSFLSVASVQRLPLQKSKQTNKPFLTPLSNISIEYLLPSPSDREKCPFCFLVCLFACLVFLPFNYQLKEVWFYSPFYPELLKWNKNLQNGIEVSCTKFYLEFQHG